MEETRKPARKPRATAAPKVAARKATAVAKAPSRKPAKPASSRSGGVPPSGPSPVEREQMVRMAAYFRAQSRGFEPGHEWEDWLAAEAEVSVRTGVVPSAPRKASTRRAKPG
ncbi:MAG: DUF2934 domain-containing protein [Steroidobacteraceae bacterium]|nr:DUF2934 domain-containing protein [Steroidobacteraceae bacterium]